MLPAGENGVGPHQGDDHLSVVQCLPGDVKILRPFPGKLQFVRDVFQGLQLVADVIGEPQGQFVRPVFVPGQKARHHGHAGDAAAVVREGAGAVADIRVVRFVIVGNRLVMRPFLRLRLCLRDCLHRQGFRWQRFRCGLRRFLRFQRRVIHRLRRQAHRPGCFHGEGIPKHRQKTGHNAAHRADGCQQDQNFLCSFHRGLLFRKSHRVTVPAPARQTGPAPGSANAGGKFPHIFRSPCSHGVFRRF